MARIAWTAPVRRRFRCLATPPSEPAQVSAHIRLFKNRYRCMLLRRETAYDEPPVEPTDRAPPRANEAVLARRRRSAIREPRSRHGERRGADRRGGCLSRDVLRIFLK